MSRNLSAPNRASEVPSPDYLTDREIERVEKGLCLNCGHKPMDHGKVVARRWEEPNPCSKCDCYKLVEAL